VKPESYLDWWRNTAGRYAKAAPTSANEELVLDMCDVARKEVSASATPMSTAHELAAAVTWARSGRPRFILSDSMAAVLTATKAPPLDNLPYPAFMVEVPRKYLPSPGPQSWATYLGVFSFTKDGTRTLYFAFASDCMSNVTESVGMHPCDLILDEETPTVMMGSETQLRGVLSSGALPSVGSGISDRGARLAMRLIANLSAYVTQYSESLSSRRPPKFGRQILEQAIDVKPPRDVVISQRFRERAAELVAAGSFDGAKRVLKHMVRGHWKKQASGPQTSARWSSALSAWMRPIDPSSPHLRSACDLR
jgi:hypothetical protein